tara:strand:+ start:70 stop:1506 length:1437 start_codon:yes stop_codon:yes gene_type:complete
MKYFKNFVSSFFFKILPVVLFVSIAHISYTQENDDLYFNKNDRKTIVQKKSLSAQEIINQYKNELEQKNIDLKENIDPNLLNKYKGNSSEVLDERVNVISKSLKYNRDNLFFRPSNKNANNNFNHYKNHLGILNSGSNGYIDPFAYERFVSGYYYNPNMYNMSWSKARWLSKLYRYNPLLLFSDPFYSMYYRNSMFSPIDFWGNSGYGFNSICVLNYHYPFGSHMYSGNYGNNYINNNYIKNTFNTMNNVSSQNKGPRISRNSGSLGGKNVDQFVKRGRSLVREGGINNDGNYQRGSNSQNEYLRSKVSSEGNFRNNISSRSDIKNSYNDQFSRRRGMNSESNSASTRKAMRIYSSYDQNTSRSSINRGSGYERNSSISSNRNNSSLNDNSGRRSNYNYSKESYNRNQNSNSSFYNRSNSSNSRSNSNFSSGNTGGFNRSSGGFSSGVSSGSSRGGSSSGGSSSGGSSSGGSSRGGVN